MFEQMSDGLVVIATGVAVVVFLGVAVRNRLVLPCAIILSYTLMGTFRLAGFYPYHLTITVGGALLIVALARGLVVRRFLWRYTGLHIALILAASIGLARAYDWDYGFALVKTYVAGLVIVWVLYRSAKSVHGLETLVAVFVGIMVVASSLGLAQAVMGGELSLAYVIKGDSWLHMNGWAPVGYSNSPFQFGHDVMVGLVPAFTAWALRRAPDSRRVSYLWLASVAIGLVALLVSTNRSSWLGFVMAMTYILLEHRKSIARTVLLLTIVTVFAVAGPLGEAFLPEARTLLSGDALLSDYRVQDRMELNSVGIAMIGEAPILGNGAGAFMATAHAHRSSALAADTMHYPHNVFLGLAADLGLLGAGALAATIVFVFLRLSGVVRDAAAMKEYRLANVCLGLKATLLAYAIDAGFHNYFIDLHLWTLLGLGIAAIAVHSRLQHASGGVTEGGWNRLATTAGSRRF